MPPDVTAVTQHRDRASFLSTGAVSTRVRPVIAQSWLRSSAAGVDPEHQLAPVVLDTPSLDSYRTAHPLSRVFPLLQDVLGRAAVDCDCVMAVGDAHGRLLWVSGAPGMLRQAEAIHFVEGAMWDENHAGTNAPGTALHLNEAVLIHSAEHFHNLVQPWSCAAAPIHDPVTQQILGLVDLTGGDDVASPQSLGLVRAAARMAEAELARLAVVDGPGLWRPPEASPTPVRITALGLPEAVAEIEGRSLRLSRRHSEILVALADAPDGLTAEQLEIALYPADRHTSTVRAEMARLRSLLGAVLSSRPYRFTLQVETDWQDVLAHLSAGRLGAAISEYRGPLLPQSDAPAVVERRDAVAGQLRAAVLASGKPDLMVAWTRFSWGADDLVMWQAQARTLPPNSPLRPMAIAEARRLEARLR